MGRKIKVVNLVLDSYGSFQWNSEIFAAITGLVGTIVGVFFGKRG